MRKKGNKRIEVLLSEAQDRKVGEIASKARSSKAEVLRRAAITLHHLPDDLEPWVKYRSANASPEKPTYKRGGTILYKDLDWEIAAVLETGLSLSRLKGKTTKFVSFDELE